MQNILSSSLLAKNLQIEICLTVILPSVLYGYEAWSFTLREGCRLRVFEIGLLRRTFGTKTDEVTRERRRLHNEELLICTQHKILG
jgi:hypothetical protein